MPPTITREDALAQGLSTYYTGWPCWHGHDAPRFVVDGACLVCSRIGWRLGRQKDKAAILCRVCGGNAESPGLCAACRANASLLRRPTPATLSDLLGRGAPAANAAADTYVYVIAAGPYSKIGVARDVAERLKGVQTGCPFAASVVHALGPYKSPVALWYERTAHKFFASRRTVGEWFEVPPQVAIDTLNALGVFE